MKVSITPKASKIAQAADLYVEQGVETQTLRNGKARHREIVEIAEEGSDFLVQYGVSGDGSLYLIVKPGHIEDLPAHITTSAQLTRVVAFLIEEAGK